MNPRIVRSPKFSHNTIYDGYETLNDFFASPDRDIVSTIPMTFFYNKNDEENRDIDLNLTNSKLRENKR